MDIKVSEKDLRAFLERVFEAEGFDKKQAAGIADVLVLADLFGIESHGVQRLRYYHENLASGSADPKAKMEIVKETPVSALIDAHFAMGQLSGMKAVELAMAKAEASGIGMVAVRNSSHFGIAGYYTYMAVQKGFCALAMTNTGPIMVPTFGKQMMLGTNPVAFAMPADPVPFWFDAATTTVSLGRIEVYDKTGRNLPRGWAVQADGTPASDAHRTNRDILDGRSGGLLPLGGEGEETGGHKGYGLALMVEAMTGVLSGGLVSPEMTGAHGDHTSHFFLVFDPDLFGERDAIRVRMSSYLQMLRESEKMPGCRRIYTPGEKAFARCRERRLNGIPIESATWQELSEIAAHFEIPLPCRV